MTRKATEGGPEFHRVGDSLGQLTRRLGLAEPDALTAVFVQWDAAVGASLALHVRPHLLDKGVLTVTVDEPGWATQLRFLHDDVVRALNDHAGKTVVERIVVRIAPAPSGPGLSHPRW